MFMRTDKLGSSKTQRFVVTVNEIRPFRNGWKCFEAPGIEPVFLDQEQAIDFAKNRACFRSVRFGLWIQTVLLNARSISAKRIDNCRAAGLYPWVETYYLKCAKFGLA
jgi:hypothetical protein